MPSSDAAVSGPAVVGSRVASLRAAVNRLTQQQLAGFAAAVVAWIGSAILLGANAGLTSWYAMLGLLSALPLYLVARGWRLPWWLHTGAAALPLSIVVLGAFSHGGWYGAARATRYGWGALLFLAVVAWATTALRRRIVAAMAVSLVLIEYALAWWPWWGAGDAREQMVGTFYWHNQLGAYCAAGLAVALGLALFSRRWYAVALGLAGVALAFCGVVESASRAAQALAALAIVLALAAAWWTARWRGVARWALAAAIALAASLLATSALFFPVAAAPWQSTSSRTVGQAWVESSGVTRLDFWRVGIEIGAQHPLLGGGLSSYGLWMRCFTPMTFTSNPHDELVLGWAEGGVVGLLPLLAVVVGVVVLAVRSARALSVSALRVDASRWALALALVLLVLHAGMDFDGMYPSLLGMMGLVGGAASAPLLVTRMKTVPGARARQTVRTAGSLVLILLLAASGVLGFVKDPQPAAPYMLGTLSSIALNTEVAHCAATD